MIWMVDAGHGGKDSGAVSGDGLLQEKDVALTVARRVRELLSPYGKALMTRADDRFLPLSERARMANVCGADLVSIHCNAGGGFGFEVFTSPGETRSDQWATAVLDELRQNFPDRRIREDRTDGDADKEARFTVLTKTARAAILVELGFIDTPRGQDFLADERNQENLARAIARGTLEANGVDFDREQLAKMRTHVPPVMMTLEQRVAQLEQRVAVVEQRTGKNL